MHILILNQVFPPDRVSSGDIFADLSVDLQARGHRVTVLTTLPHFNCDPTGRAKQPLTQLWGPLLWKSSYQGNLVYHTFMPKKSADLWRRVLAWSCFHALSILAGMLLIRRVNVILVVSPPLTIGFVGWVLARAHRCRYVYNVQELYPDLAIDIAAIRNPQLIRLLFMLERFVYANAASVTTIGERIAERIRAKGVERSKVRVIPNPANIDSTYEVPKDNVFSRRHDVHQKFVVSYAGNIGRAQGLATFVDAASLLQHDKRIQFMMIGSGVERVSLEARVRSLGLRNFRSLPYQPTESMPQILATSELCLVPLVAGIGDEALPSKSYRTMAAGKPLLAVADKDSELAYLVETARCGWAVPPNSPQLLAEAIAAACDDPTETRNRGHNGRGFVQAHNSRQLIADRYTELLQNVADYR